VESYENNIKRTYGGLSMNGVMHMADSYGTAGEEEILYWTIFGDPSVVVRTDTPTDMTVSHNDVMIIGAEEFSIETGMAAALVAVSRDGELLASTYTDANGGTTLEFAPPLEIPGPVDLVVTAFNKMPYETTVNVIAPDGAYMLMGDIAVTGGADQILDYGETGSIYNIRKCWTGSFRRFDFYPDSRSWDGYIELKCNSKRFRSSRDRSDDWSI